MTSPGGRGGEVGKYVLPIMPSIEGIGPEIDRKLGRAFAGVSKSASKALSDGVRDGVAEAEAAVKKSSAAIEKLREKEAGAADRLRVAEERINEVREKGGSALARAEAQRNAAMRTQQSALRDIERQTKSLTDAQERLADAQKKAADGPSNAGSWIDKLKSKASDAIGSLDGIGDKLGGSGDGAGAAFLEGFSSEISGIGSKAGPIGMAITAAASVALAGGALIAKNVLAGMEQEQSQADVQAKLGVDDSTMKRIAAAAAKSYAGNFGDSISENMDAARAAIQSGLLDPNAGSGAQSAMISQLDTVHTLLGEDIPNVARAASQAIRTGLAPDATAAFDLITKGQQAGLNVSEDWLDTLNEYGTQFRKLGLDGPQAVGLLSQMLKGGARDTDVAADALKEFSIRAIDGSKTTMGAFETLGLSFQGMTTEFGAGGDRARTAFQLVIDKIRGIQDPVEKANVQVALFGTQSEDLGAALNSIDMSTAVDQLGQVQGATQRAADTIGGTNLSKWETLDRTVETAVDGMQQSLAGVFGPLVGDFADGLTNNQSEIIGFFTVVGEAAVSFGQLTVGSISETIRGVALLVNAVGDAYGGVTKVGASLQRLAGRDDVADEWDRLAEKGFGLADGIYKVADSGDALVGKLGEAREELDKQGAAAQKAAQLNTALGTAVASIPDGKDIVITDNTPETTTRLRALGIEVQETPNGLTITAKTDEAKQILDAFRDTQGDKPVDIPVGVDPAKAQQQLAELFAKYPIVQPGAGNVPRPPASAPNTGPFYIPVPRADGAIDSIGSQAHIGGPAYPNGLVRYREPKTGGEAYIPLAGGERSVDIWKETGRRLGVWKFDTGGFAPDVLAAEQLAGTEYSQGNRTDCSGMAARVINRALGLPDSGLMSTKNAQQWLAERGFRPGIGGPGAITVGWYDRGPNPNDGHMAMTLSNGMNAEAGGKNGVFTVGAGATGGSDSQFDQHMFLPVTGMYGEGPGSDGSISGAYSLGGGTGGSYLPPGATPGIDPDTGEAGYYAPDAKAVREANQKVADADARVRQAELRKSELDADAKESQKQAAQDELDKAKREAADARADAQDAQRGKFTKAKTASGGGADGGPDVSGVGGIFGSFLKETLGLDGSLFPDPSQLGIVQLANALLGIKYTPQGKGFPWQTGYANGNGTPWSGSPQFAAAGVAGDGGGTSGLPFGMIPSAIDAAGRATPGMAPPGTPASGIGAGPAPGPVDMSRNVSIQVDSGPTSGEIANVVRKQVANVDRLHTYVPKGA